jgi:hypothetical protein
MEIQPCPTGGCIHRWMWRMEWRRAMEIKINIDEEHIAELVSQEIARRIVAEHGYENREARIGIRDGVDKAIKQYIYSKKDVVIERVVERATTEIVKKGLPRLFEEISKQVKV